MAHQAHKLPWNTFASHFKFQFADPGFGEKSTMYAKRQRNEIKQFNYFIEAFIQNLAEHSASERRKYPTYTEPDSDDVLITDEVAKKITPSVFKMKEYRNRDWVTERLKPGKFTRRLCDHHDTSDESKCRCPLPFVERKASACMRAKAYNNCYEFWKKNDKPFFNLELVKILILYGEMEPVLRAAHCSGNSYLKWYREAECYDTAFDLGWDDIVQKALRAYIFLNLLLCRPEMWDPKCGKTDLTDYRRLAEYQSTVKYLTKGGTGSDVASRVHRSFFGIRDTQFNKYLPWDAKSLKRKKYELAFGEGKRLTLEEIPFGRIPFPEFLEFETIPGEEEDTFLPLVSDVVWVRGMLRSKGLPAELALDIMDRAEYTARRRLPVEHDPLHLDNRQELMKYLTYCWQTLVRCDMFARELHEEGWEDHWRDELTMAIFHIAYDGLPYHSMWKHRNFNDNTYLCEGFKD